MPKAHSTEASRGTTSSGICNSLQIRQPWIGPAPPPCWNREGVKWLEERVDNGREAELKPRVDRRRIRSVYAAEGDSLRLAAELHAYRQDLTALDRAQGEDDIVIDVLCEVPEVSVAEEAAR